MHLETKRLYLRQPKREDAQAYCDIHNSYFVLRYNAVMPTTPERMEARFQDEEYLSQTVFLEEKESGKLIGAIFWEDDDLRYGVASKNISYFIEESYAGQGFMKEAMHAVLSYLFETQKLDCICARAFAPNEASRALLRSLGFRENGIIPLCVKGYGNMIYDDVIHTLFPKDLI